MKSLLKMFIIVTLAGFRSLCLAINEYKPASKIDIFKINLMEKKEYVGPSLIKTLIAIIQQVKD